MMLEGLIQPTPPTLRLILERTRIVHGDGSAVGVLEVNVARAQLLDGASA